MRWPWKHRAHPDDREGKERAKQQLAISEVIRKSARELAREHVGIQQANHFGPTIDAAMREPRRR